MYLCAANKCSFCLKSASPVFIPFLFRFHFIFILSYPVLILFLSLFLATCLWLFFNKIIFVSPLAASFLSIHGEPARTVWLHQHQTFWNKNESLDSNTTYLSKQVATEWLIHCRLSVDKLKHVHPTTMLFHDELKEVFILKSLQHLMRKQNCNNYFLILKGFDYLM